jgi:hypothetical protein
MANDFVVLNYPHAEGDTFLLGIRKIPRRNPCAVGEEKFIIAGNYREHEGEIGFVFIGTLSGRGSFHNLAFPSRAGAIVASTNVFGPAYLGHGRIRVCGFYTTFDHPGRLFGCLFTGKLCTKGHWQRIHPQGATRTILHSTIDNWVIGNAETEDDERRAFAYDICHKHFRDVSKPDAVSTTVSGICRKLLRREFRAENLRAENGEVRGARGVLNAADRSRCGLAQLRRAEQFRPAQFRQAQFRQAQFRQFRQEAVLRGGREENFRRVHLICGTYRDESDVEGGFTVELHKDGILRNWHSFHFNDDPTQPTRFTGISMENGAVFVTGNSNDTAFLLQRRRGTNDWKQILVPTGFSTVANSVDENGLVGVFQGENAVEGFTARTA